MMQSKKSLIWLSLIFLCSFCWHNVSAQSQGYVVVGDSIYSEGFIYYNPVNPKRIEFKTSKESASKEFNSDQVTKFGYNNGAKFITRQVLFMGKIQNVFLEILAEGDLDLYLTDNDEGKKFYINKDALILLKKENLAQAIQPYAIKCAKNEWQLKRLNLSRASLEHYARNLNKGKCTSVHFSSFGMMMGLNLSTLTIQENASQYNKFGSYSMVSENIDAGVFAETPIWLVNNLSFVSQLSYGKMKFSKSLSNLKTDQDVKIDFDLLKLNLKPKYAYNLNKIALFVEAGAELLYLLNQSEQLIEANHNGNRIDLNEPVDFMQMQKWQYGVAAGTGVLYYYLPKQYVSLGINAVHAFGKSHAINNFSTTLRINI